MDIQKRRSRNTKEKMIRATRLAIVKKGWASVSSRDIAEASGVNVALINYHFGGKKKLMLETLNRAVDALWSNFVPSEPIESLSAFMAATVLTIPKMVKDPNRRVLIAAFDEMQHDKDIARAVALGLNRLRTNIERIVCESGIAEEQVQGVVSIIAAFLDGMAIHFMIDRKTDLKAVEETFRDYEWVETA